MIKIVDTKRLSGQEDRGDSAVLHSPSYILVCEDTAENQFEIETDKGTYLQVADFIDKLKSV